MNVFLILHFIESFWNVKEHLCNLAYSKKLENISWVMAKNWWTQKSPGLNPDWVSSIRLLSIRYENMKLERIRPKTLMQTGRREAGLCFLTHWFPIFFVLERHLFFFPFWWKNALHWTRFADNIKKSNHIVAMSFIWINFADDAFKILYREISIQNLFLHDQGK